jgi:phosphatidylserine/phosphatidylglycerophosphate/cardiolipin synthase-like enzyme
VIHEELKKTARVASIALLVALSLTGCRQPDQPQPDQEQSAQRPRTRLPQQEHSRNDQVREDRDIASQKPVPANAVEVHYAPFENLERIDTDLFARAHSTIDLAAYSLTDYAIAEALIAAAQRGVHIRIYRDATQAAGEAAHAERTAANPKRRTSRDPEDDVPNDTDSADILQRLINTPHITVRIKHSHILMHLKAYAIDGTYLRTGSANFSPTGEKRQDNDLIVFHNPAAAIHFTQDFDRLWSRPDNEPAQ